MLQIILIPNDPEYQLRLALSQPSVISFHLLGKVGVISDPTEEKQARCLKPIPVQ